MNNYLLKINSELLKNIRIIGKIADKNNVEAYIVGGIVRDIILKRTNPSALEQLLRQEGFYR